MSTPQSRAKSLTLLKLSSIFGQNDIATRMKAIADLWVPSADVLFVDALGVFKSHKAISDMVDKIQKMGRESDEFIALGDVECLKHDDEDDVWATKVKWGIKGSGSGKMELTGEDILTIVCGRIKICYTFLDSK